MIDGAKIVDPKVEISKSDNKLTLVTKQNRGRQEYRFDRNGRKIYEVNSDGFTWGSSRHSTYQYDEKGLLTLFDWSVTEGIYPRQGREKTPYRKRVAYQYEGDSLEYQEVYEFKGPAAA